MVFIISALALAAAQSTPARPHDGPTVDELTFGRSLNGIIDGYRVCGLPLTDLGDIPARFERYAQSHRQYTQTMTQVYAKRNAATRAILAASPSYKSKQCFEASRLRVQAVATAKRSIEELDEAHARAEAAAR